MRPLDRLVAFEPSGGSSRLGGLSVQSCGVATTLVGYARCSTDKQDLEAQHGILLGLGVAADRIYVDRGLTGTRRARPGLDQALAAVHPGDTLVVPKLDRLARSVPDAREIGDSLSARGVKLSLGGSLYDPTDPMGMKRRCTGPLPQPSRPPGRPPRPPPPRPALTHTQDRRRLTTRHRAGPTIKGFRVADCGQIPEAA